MRRLYNMGTYLQADLKGRPDRGPYWIEFEAYIDKQQGIAMCQRHQIYFFDNGQYSYRIEFKTEMDRTTFLLTW